MRKRVVGLGGSTAGRVALCCAGALALAACGQRGPLMLPDAKLSKSVAHQQASAARAASAPSAASAVAPWSVGPSAAPRPAPTASQNTP